MPILGIVYMFKYLEGCTITEEEFDILKYNTNSAFMFSYSPPIHFVDTELFGTEFYGNINIFTFFKFPYVSALRGVEMTIFNTHIWLSKLLKITKSCLL